MKTKSQAKRTVSYVPLEQSMSESVGNVRPEEMPIENPTDNNPIENPDVCDGGEDARYEDDADDFGEEDEEEEEEEAEHIPVEEIASHALSNQFGHVAVDDDDSEGEDMWREDAIPEPLSDEDAEGKEHEATGQPSEDREAEGEDMFKLGKCYSSGDEFKQALLRYSLLTRYDIKLYMSTEKRLGAVCSDEEKSCKWRVYCSYERRKRKLETKYVEDKHTCIRSGFSKMLKCSTIRQSVKQGGNLC